jgi:dTMP kinase
VGVFIAIEGGDGSGKGTQAELLAAYARDELNRNVLKISFPQYGKPSARYAELYLNGAYGGADEVAADLASLAYAIDRYDARKVIEPVIEKPDGFVIADRYVASNLAHQGTKFATESERHAYYERMMETEFGVLGIPEPSLNIVLLVPTAIAQSNVDKKAERSYTTLKRDIHEADASHLERAKANYEELCRLYPERFKGIDCLDKNQQLRSIESIQAEIQTMLKSLTD